MSNLSNNNSTENNNPLTPTDPRLTALALGELQDDRLMAEVEKDPALKAEFDRIRKIADALRGVYVEEAKSPIPAAKTKKKAADTEKVVPFYFRPIYLSGAIAACLILAFLLVPENKAQKQEEQRLAEQHRVKAQEQAVGGFGNAESF